MASIRRLLVLLCVCAALGVTPPAFAGTNVGEIEMEPASVGFDMVVLRPFGLLALGVGVALAIPATLATAITRPDRIRDPIEFLVVRPAVWTFGAPPGSHR